MQPVTTVDQSSVSVSASQPIVVDQPVKPTLFARAIQPFIGLMARVGERAVFASLVAQELTYQMLSAIHLVFYRLIFAPPFNPYSRSFKEVTLANFEQRVPLLKQQIALLDQKFQLLPMISKDMKDLAQLTDEIKETRTKLSSFLTILQTRQIHVEVEKDIQCVFDLYQDLNKQLDAYYKNEGFNILKKYQTVLDTFKRGGSFEILPEIRKELISTWKSLSASMNCHLSALDKTALDLLGYLKKQLKRIKTQSNENHPLRLKNIGNSCYLDSVLQAFACVDSVCKELKRHIPWEPDKCHPTKKFTELSAAEQKMHREEYEHKREIQKAIIQFLEMQKKNRKNGSSQKHPLSAMQYFLSLREGPSLHTLRYAIFNSKLNFDLSDMSQLKNQQDAGAVAELLLDCFLKTCHYKWQKTITSDAFPGIEVECQTEEMTMLQIPINGIKEDESDEDSDDESDSIDSFKIETLIRNTMKEETDDPNNAFAFDPKKQKTKVIDLVEGPKSQELPAQMVPKYTNTFKFKELPPVLTLQFKRFKANPVTQMLEKIDDPVILPDDGIIDLSAHGLDDSKYKLKSLVVHHGGLGGGHYDCLVEIEGKYFQTDDNDSNFYEEISEEKFFGTTKAYMAVFVKV